MQSPLPLVALMLLGCAGQQTAPSSPPVDMVARCAEVLGLAENLFPTERYSFVAEHCVVPMVRDRTCRDAVVRSLGIDATSRSRLVGEACSRAYCSRIRAPKPELCARDAVALSAAELQPLGIELFARVRVIELGAAEAQRWDQVIGSPAAPPSERTALPSTAVEPTPPIGAEPEPAKVVPAPKAVAPTASPKALVPAPARSKAVAPTPPAKVVAPAPPKASPALEPSHGEIRLRIRVRDHALYVAIGDESWSLPEKPAASDFNTPAGRVGQLAKRGERVIIEVGPGILYHHLVGILNALGERQIRNISISSIKE